jgi:hypothetical protein
MLALVLESLNGYCLGFDLFDTGEQPIVIVAKPESMCSLNNSQAIPA